MEFINNITPEDMKQLVEDSFISPIWNAASRNDCKIEVAIDQDLVPVLNLVVPNDAGIKVQFETMEILEDDVVVGYEFKPTITNDEIIEEDAEAAIFRFQQWAEISQLALDIYSVEIRPYEFFD